jgi:hypothetical protein
MEKPAAKPRKREIWHPPSYTPADIRAIQALALFARAAEVPPEPGEEPVPPTAFDVKRALDWIINAAAATYDNGFVAGDAGGRLAAFMDGRQFVGQQIVKLMKLKPAIFETEK